MGAHRRGRHTEAVARFRKSDELQPSLETKAMIAKAERAASSKKKKS